MTTQNNYSQLISNEAAQMRRMIECARHILSSVGYRDDYTLLQVSDLHTYAGKLRYHRDNAGNVDGYVEFWGEVTYTPAAAEWHAAKQAEVEFKRWALSLPEKPAGDDRAFKAMRYCVNTRFGQLPNYAQRDDLHFDELGAAALNLALA